MTTGPCITSNTCITIRNQNATNNPITTKICSINIQMSTSSDITESRSFRTRTRILTSMGITSRNHNATNVAKNISVTANICSRSSNHTLINLPSREKSRRAPPAQTISGCYIIYCQSCDLYSLISALAVRKDICDIFNLKI